MGYLRYQLVGVRRSFAEDYICGDEGHESGYGLTSDRRKVFYRLEPLDTRKREGHSLITHSQGGGYTLGRTRVCNCSSHMDQETQEA